MPAEVGSICSLGMAMMLEEPLVRQQQKRLLKGTKRKHLSEEPETGLFGTLHDCTVPRWVARQKSCSNLQPSRSLLDSSSGYNLLTGPAAFQMGTWIPRQQ